MLIALQPSKNTTATTAFHPVLQSSQAASMMLHVQMMMTQDLDTQLKSVVEKIKFLSDVKKKYRKNINAVQKFLAQNPVASRNDGKRYLNASFSQARELFSQFQEYTYNLNEKKIQALPMTLEDNGEKHRVDDDGYTTPQNNKTSLAEWVSYFDVGSRLTDSGEAIAFAKKVSSDDGHLPFYFGHMNNKDENGFPIFAVFTDPLETLLQRMQNLMTDVEQESEQLSLKMNQLVAQRRSSLEATHQILQKTAEIKNKAVSS